jgi:hypothetical protein
MPVMHPDNEDEADRNATDLGLNSPQRSVHTNNSSMSAQSRLVDLLAETTEQLTGRHSSASSTTSNDVDRVAAAVASAAQMQAAMAALVGASTESLNSPTKTRFEDQVLDTPIPASPPKNQVMRDMPRGPPPPPFQEASLPLAPIVHWEKVRFVRETDEDFVPLQDYTKEKGLGASLVSVTPNASSNSTRDASNFAKPRQRRSGMGTILSVLFIAGAAAAWYHYQLDSSGGPLLSEEQAPVETVVDVEEVEEPTCEIELVPWYEQEIEPLPEPETVPVEMPSLESLEIPPPPPRSCHVPFSWIVVPACRRNGQGASRAVQELLQHMVQ